MQEAFDEDENASAVMELIAAANSGGDEGSAKAMDLSGGKDDDSNDVNALDESKEEEEEAEELDPEDDPVWAKHCIN